MTYNFVQMYCRRAFLPSYMVHWLVIVGRRFFHFTQLATISEENINKTISELFLLMHFFCRLQQEDIMPVIIDRDFADFNVYYYYYDLCIIIKVGKHLLCRQVERHTPTLLCYRSFLFHLGEQILRHPCTSPQQDINSVIV